ncbi:bifunctional 3'-5' exonuclease/ATP-dependent helicase WRN-like [Saccoglossus kowalevskii]|uniref:DNA 3'-5' helicase n=1 Tax=Saccoglossus kowalevskii TaxID=10224 RepID=A0ABM0H1N5_SACKO|nr:PREDICTED: Werner syndrome ATP-dependent helicase-like [Saccoglossus kowalevskii]
MAAHSGSCVGLDVEAIQRQYPDIKQLTGIQTKAIQALLSSDSDVFVVSRTGSGKSLCFYALPALRPSSVVIVLSPLLSIMEEQVLYLRAHDVTATYIGRNETEDEDIRNAKFQVLFGSPEMIIGNEKWRKVWKSDVYQTRVLAIVVDEAHTVTLWGEDGPGEKAFRECFSRIGELRSLLTAPLMALTATASSSKRKKIMSRLNMKNTRTLMLVESPDRPNIKLGIAQVKRTENHIAESFEWLLEILEKQKENMERYIIFCKSIQDCARIHFLFNTKLKSLGRMYNMFHSKTPNAIKQLIKEDMSIDGNIKVLICTNAAGMGVNFHNVHNIIHYGPPRELDTFLQQIGRGGRDGKQSQQLLIYNKTQIRKIDLDMLSYIRNQTECRRKILLQNYNVTCTGSSDAITHNHCCCDICEQSCTCEQEVCPMQHVYYKETKRIPSSHVVRNVTTEQKQLLTSALDAYRVSINLDVCDESFIVPSEASHGFSEFVIGEIVDKCACLFSADDVMQHIHIWSYAHAKEVIKIINVIFDDSDIVYTNDEDDIYSYDDIAYYD